MPGLRGRDPSRDFAALSRLYDFRQTDTPMSGVTDFFESLGVTAMREPTLWERLCFKVTGLWPWSYAADRLAHADEIAAEMRRLPPEVLYASLLKDSDA